MSPSYGSFRSPRPSNSRSSTFPSYNTSRKKPRRWPLVLRFVKGAVHVDIAIAVILHAAFTALICYWQVEKNGHLSIPSSVVPSLSIVVGLMLVFRQCYQYTERLCNRCFLTHFCRQWNKLRSFLAGQSTFHDRRHEHPQSYPQLFGLLAHLQRPSTHGRRTRRHRAYRPRAPGSRIRDQEPPPRRVGRRHASLAASPV